MELIKHFFTTVLSHKTGMDIYWLGMERFAV
jgi:hypothetical protein